jgi:hypothetical protein
VTEVFSIAVGTTQGSRILQIVLSIADEGINQFTANITLTKRPASKEQKFSTKADKNADKIKRKSQEKSADQPKETTQRQLYRLSINF